MSLFLSLAGIMGRTPEQVVLALQHYAQEHATGFMPAMLEEDHPDRCVVSGEGPNTTLVYPPSHVEWDE